MKITKLLAVAAVAALASCSGEKRIVSDKPEYSGIYPHLAYYNNEGECGTGAVVPWADRLWVITYAPHKPYGSSDKLYEITAELESTVRPESTGGTPANRMIHAESSQLFIGPYAIDKNRNVRVISYDSAPGRYTGAARHITDPANKIYIATMEEGFYEVDVHSLETKTLYKDGNGRKNKHEDTHVNPGNDLLPGCHGKGLYSGQGVMVFSNNGENTKEAQHKFDVTSGSLSEWDGAEWKVIRRNQFTEVTGPGGIYGNPDPDNDPLWATGWDYKSLILAVRDNDAWHYYRLPKASFTYDGAHGWNTEWPRIRDIGAEGKPDYLMTMHGMFWRFPETFTAASTGGIRPRSAYLKVIGDFARWHDKLVFGCDDSAQKEFLNKRKAKGAIEGPGQSNSNLWFTSFDRPDNLGPTTAGGSVWLRENVAKGEFSDPFLFSGWKNRAAWIKSDSPERVEFAFEVDIKGNNVWTPLKKAVLEPDGSAFIPFGENESGEWIRVSVDNDTQASVSFVFAPDETRGAAADAIFKGIARIGAAPSSSGILYGLGDNRRALGILANTSSGDNIYYEMDGGMNIVRKSDPETEATMLEMCAIPKQVVEVESGSVLVVDDLGRRWRLPLGDRAYDPVTMDGSLRICREVATERDLFSCHGTFYELPAENADGYAKIRPVSSHNYHIHDYASYRGLLVMTGLDHERAAGNPHAVFSQDGELAVWAGTIDDLWKLGKPVGSGGPWVDARVKARETSDPYLIGFYDKRILSVSHKSKSDVVFTAEVDPTGDGTWTTYDKFTVKPGESFSYEFPASFQARWIRFSADKDTVATTWLEYK